MDVDRLKKGHMFMDDYLNRQLETIREIWLSERNRLFQTFSKMLRELGIQSWLENTGTLCALELLQRSVQVTESVSERRIFQ